MITLLFLLLTLAIAVALWSKREVLSVSLFGLTLVLGLTQLMIDMDTVLHLTF